MKRIIEIISIFVLILFFLATIFVTPRIIKINSISCSSQYGKCEESFEKELQNSLGKSLFDAKKEIGSLLKSKNFIEASSLRFLVPSILKIDVVTRKAAYALGDDTLGYLLVDTSGVVLAKTDRTTLPYLSLSTPIIFSGGKVSEKTLFALDILNYLSVLYNQKSGNLNKDWVEFTLAQGPKVIFPLEGDKEVLIGSLRLIMGGLNSYIENHRIEKAQNQVTIDLRFKNPVIK